MDADFQKRFLASVVALTIVISETGPYLHEKADLSHLDPHDHVAKQNVEPVGSQLVMGLTTTASSVSLRLATELK